MKLSVIIVAKNEEPRIKACLESVKWADEIVFVDNGSTDKTTSIARSYTDNILSIEKLDYADIKNRAFEKTTGEWVLYIDADERVLAPLKQEIEAIISNENPEFQAYAISRINVILGSVEKYGPFWPDWIIRLVKRDQFKEWSGSVHETLTFQGKLGYTKNSFLHLTHRDIDQMVLKNLNWSRIDAKLRLDANHPAMCCWRFLRILFGELFYQGIIRKGFFNGSVGTIDSVVQAFSLFITYVRLWEMQQNPSLDERYKNIDKDLISSDFNFKEDSK